MEDFSDHAYRDKNEAIQVLREEAQNYIKEHKRDYNEKLELIVESDDVKYSITVQSPKRHYITYTMKEYYL